MEATLNPGRSNWKLGGSSQMGHMFRALNPKPSMIKVRDWSHLPLFR
jgi:hypothetical protein